MRKKFGLHTLTTTDLRQEKNNFELRHFIFKTQHTLIGTAVTANTFLVFIQTEQTIFGP